MKRIYFDYAATTPLDASVFSKMKAFFREEFGNSSSIHHWGQQAENALETSRETVAGLLNCSPEEVIFTSGGSESDNLALRGAAFARRAAVGANRILISPVEHPAVAETARQLHDVFGFELDILPTDSYGRIDPGELKKKISQNTAIVSIIYGNNEIGTINPISTLAEICRQAGVPMHTDAVQAGAHLKLDMRADDVDLLSLGAHKFYGPKGVGVLFVQKGTTLLPMQTGGKQEFGIRAGTHNLAYIVGFAEALKITRETMNENRTRVSALRDIFILGVLASVSDVKLTGHPQERLPNHASFVFRNVDGNELLMVLDQKGFACSSGSACKVGDPKPSGVLLAMGLSEDWAAGSLRVTLGRNTTDAEVRSFLSILPGVIASLRK